MSTHDLLKEKGYYDMECIGRGTFGKVFKCKNKKHELVAIKIIKIENHEEVNNVLNESIRLIKLNHSNIVKVYNVYLLSLNVIENQNVINNESKFKVKIKMAIEMEYLKFGNLFQLIFKDKINLSENLIYKILQQSCSVLKYLEENEIIHRDIKLENIVVKHLDLQKEEIEIVFIDFGLIKELNSTKTFSLEGTIGYIAPELKDDDNYDYKLYSFKTDIFALGVTIYRLMSLEKLLDIGASYCVFNENIVKELIINNIKKNIQFKYSDKLINLILKMLEKEVNNRFNVDQILKELYQINDLNTLQNINLQNNNLILQNKLYNFNNNTNENITKINGLTKFEEKEEFNLIGFSNKFEFVGQFGSLGSGNGQFDCPYDILIDNDLIYIVDLNNKRISLFNLENNQFIKQFNLNFKPSCIKLDKTNDTLLIGDRYYNGDVIYRFNKNFELLQQYGNNNGFTNLYFSITGIEVDESNGNIFICNLNYGKVQILTKDFKLTKEFTNNLNGPWDILLNNEKNELIISDCDFFKPCIKIFTKDGQFIKSIGTKGNKESEFNCPRGFIYDIVNNQYIICDSGNHRIQIFNENFEFIKSFGKYGNGQNEFNYPINLTINYKTGQLFIVDQINHCIKIYK